MKNIKIKMIFLLLIMTIFTTKFIFFSTLAIQANLPITPNGTIVPYQTISTDISSSERYKLLLDEQKYIDQGAIRIDEQTNKYNSHSYAWYNQNYVSNNCNISNEDVMKFFQDGSYCESNGNEGDIICYWRIKLEYSDLTKQNITKAIPYLAHSGIITSINDTFNHKDLDTLKNITVISKWGRGGLFEHSGDNNPYYYDSIHGSNKPIDTLHFEHTNSNYIDDALFYVNVYTPRVDSVTDITCSEFPYNFEQRINPNGYVMYKLNILNSGTFKFKTESSALSDIKLYNSHMNLIYDQEVNSSSTSYISANISAGLYYMRVSFKNSSATGDIKTIIECISNSINTDSGILVDSQFPGSEIYLNNGIAGGDTITEGFTRYLFLNPAVAPSISRLDYEWYSSSPGKVMVTQYGTVLAKNSFDNQEVTITAIYKKDRSIIFSKTFIILDETKTFETNPIYVYSNMTIQQHKATLLVLPNDSPYNFNQYYTWSSNNNLVTVSPYGTIVANTTESFTITGTYTYNKRVRVVITVNVQ